MQNTSTSRSTDFRRQKTITSKNWLCMGEVSVQVTEPRRRLVRRPGPSQIKMYGFCRLFRAMNTGHHQKLQRRSYEVTCTGKCTGAILNTCSCELSGQSRWFASFVRFRRRQPHEAWVRSNKIRQDQGKSRLKGNSTGKMNFTYRPGTARPDDEMGSHIGHLTSPRDQRACTSTCFSTTRDDVTNLRSHFVIRTCRSQSIFSLRKENWSKRLSPHHSPAQTLTYNYVKFIFLWSSPLNSGFTTGTPAPEVNLPELASINWKLGQTKKGLCFD